MKYLFFSVLLMISFASDCLGQISCSKPLAVNERPDTITVYEIFNTQIPVTAFPDTKPLSNYSLNHRKFRLYFFPFVTNGVIVSTKKYLFLQHDFLLTDSLECTIAKMQYNGFILKRKKQVEVYFFPNESGQNQNVVFASMKRRNLSFFLNYMNLYLK